MLHGDVHGVVQRILKLANDIILDMTIVTGVVIRSEKKVMAYQDLNTHFVSVALPKVLIDLTC